MRKNLIVRWTEERETLLEQLREKLRNSSREVEKIHGSPTNAAVVDEAFKALEKELETESAKQKKK